MSTGVRENLLVSLLYLVFNVFPSGHSYAKAIALSSWFSVWRAGWGGVGGRG